MRGKSQRNKKKVTTLKHMKTRLPITVTKRWVNSTAPLQSTTTQSDKDICFFFWLLHFVISDLLISSRFLSYSFIRLSLCWKEIYEHNCILFASKDLHNPICYHYAISSKCQLCIFFFFFFFLNFPYN